MQITCNVTVNKTGKPSAAAMKEAMKLTKQIINEHTPKVIGEALGAQIPNVYNWGTKCLVPGKFVTGFVALFGDGLTLDQIKPDHYCIKG